MSNEQYIDMKEMARAANLIFEEYKRATLLFKPFNSAHEGYAVIKEELEELWGEIKKRRSIRSRDVMRTEAVHVGAMALRFILDICNGEDLVR